MPSTSAANVMLSSPSRSGSITAGTVDTSSVPSKLVELFSFFFFEMEKCCLL